MFISPWKKRKTIEEPTAEIPEDAPNISTQRQSPSQSRQSMSIDAFARRAYSKSAELPQGHDIGRYQDGPRALQQHGRHTNLTTHLHQPLDREEGYKAPEKQWQESSISDLQPLTQSVQRQIAEQYTANGSILAFPDYTTRQFSPQSLSPYSPYGHGQTAPQEAVNGRMVAFPASMAPQPSLPQEDRSSADTIQQLQRRVAELERECHHVKSVFALAHTVSGLPDTPPSAYVQNQWRARTEARKRIFCSINRAGNALCSWHDARRERRMYPPRNAPAGFLNCGCTYEELLFEETLARHGVGSCHPGERVRMDPALRNPLLKLLQTRYDYKDGAFDYDPITETWNEGESPAFWDQKAQSGKLVRRWNENPHLAH